MYKILLLRFSGIDVDYLILRLINGHRLLCPEHFPEPISRLVKTCFQKDPDVRPGFEEILCQLHVAYKSMIDNRTPKESLAAQEDDQNYLVPIHKSVNDSMMKQYTKVLKENRSRRSKNKEEIKETGLLESHSLDYVSLQNFVKVDIFQST